jgi:hypothetical protein
MPSEMELPEDRYPEARETFFSKGQACLRTSPLAKTHGFGIHFDKDGKVALYGMNTPKYQKFVDDPGIKKLKAIRSSKK